MSSKSDSPLLLSELTGIAEKLNIAFKLELVLGEGRNSQGQKVPERDAHVQVLFNGREVDIQAGWDLLAIVASGRVPGGYYLGNCGCGEPGCAGIWSPIMVRHQDDAVIWCVPSPYVRKRNDSSTQLMTRLSFDLQQYQAQSEGLLADFRRAATDGGPLIRLNCYPGHLPLSLIAESEGGWEGYGGKVALLQIN